MKLLLVAPDLGFLPTGEIAPGGLQNFGRCVARALASSPDIQVEDISVNELNYAATDYAWFVVSCTVLNNTEDSGTAAVALRTIDDWAYARKVLRLSGHVEPGERVRLSVLHFMDYRMFHKLKKYEVKSVELH